MKFRVAIDGEAIGIETKDGTELYYLQVTEDGSLSITVDEGLRQSSTAMTKAPNMFMITGDVKRSAKKDKPALLEVAVCEGVESSTY